MSTAGGNELAVVFRRCPACGQRNIVNHGQFVCGMWGADLPTAWNFDHREAPDP